MRRLGFTPHSSGALRGDVRDAATVKRLLQDAAKIPEFLTVSISDWYALIVCRSCNSASFRALA